jgi:hypothetical protein
MGVVDPPSDVIDLRPVNLGSKNYRCRTYTPHAGEERDSDKRTMGVPISASVKEDRMTRKFIAASPIPPALDEETGLRSRTMGWVDGDDHHRRSGRSFSPSIEKNSRFRSSTSADARGGRRR